MYQVPLKFIKCGPFVSICATRIVAMVSTETNQARIAIQEEKRAGTLINGCGRDKAKTAIFLDNGTVVSSPLSIARISTAIDKATAVSVTGRNGTESSDKFGIKTVYKDLTFDDSLMSEIEENAEALMDDEEDDGYNEYEEEDEENEDDGV